MKLVKVLSTAILLLLPGAFAPVYAQEHREQEKQPEHKQEAKQPPQHQATEHQQPARAAEQPKRAEHQEQAKPPQQQQGAEHQQPTKPPQQQQRAEHQQQANRPQPTEARGRIPDDRFQAGFGRGHTFHVNRSDFAGGSRRFQYGGYWFSMVNPWPVEWLYTDYVYVDYMNGGYFLCNPVHPGVYVSINVG
jgi:hypothetical protein